MLRKKQKKGDESVRPWGHYKITSQTKKIYVKPNRRLSLQYHKNRDEFWNVLKGSGIVTINKKEFSAKKGDCFSIPKKVMHRLKAGSKGIEILEFSSGEVSENDIVRVEDDYGRL